MLSCKSSTNFLIHTYIVGKILLETRYISLNRLTPLTERLSSFESCKYSFLAVNSRFASLKQGGRGWLAFGDRIRNPQSFRRARICKFSRQKHRFLQLPENRPFVVVKRLTHIQASSLKCPF